MSRMNAGIILSGQQPNMMNVLEQSSRAAAITNDNIYRNQLAQTFQEHGPGILAGEQGALNALARRDPRQAFGIQQANRQNERQDLRLLMDKQELGLRIREFNRTASAAEKAEARAEAERIITRAGALYRAGDLDGINRELAAVDEEPIQSLEDYPIIAGMYGDALDVLKDAKTFNAPPAPLSGPGRVQADINAGVLPPDTPLRGQGTTVNVGDIQRSAEAGVVDPEAVQPSDAFQGDISGAVGTEGFVTGAINSIGEAIQLGQASPSVDQAQTAMTSLSTKTMLGLSAEFPGRPSNLTRERIEDLTIKPGSVWTGPERALNKTRDMIETLDDSIRAANAVLLDPIYSKQDKAQAKTALRQLTTLFADYKALEQSLVAPQAQDGKNTTQSGVSWEVVE